MATNIITAEYSDGKIDEKNVWTEESEVVLGHGSESHEILVSFTADKNLKVIVKHDPDDEIPSVTLQQVANGERWYPEVGDGCSCGNGGDSYPYTVRRVSPSGKTIWVSRDTYKVKPGKGAPYEEGPKDCWFFPQDVPDTQWTCFKLKKDGRFRESGKTYRGQPSLCFGRRFSQDPHF